MTRTAALCTLLLTLAACGRSSSQQDGDELLQQEQSAARQAGAKQAQDMLAASVNDTSAAQITQLEADVEALKASQQGKQLDAMTQQLDDQHAQILALQTEVDDLKSAGTTARSAVVGKTSEKVPPAKKPAATHAPALPRAAAHPNPGNKP